MADGSEIRGKVGGKVYSRNASGAYVRKYTKPTNPQTALQSVARNNFADISQAYRELSAVERQSYENMREFYKTQDSVGNTITPTASQLFARVNGNLLQNGIINMSGLKTICPAPQSFVSPATMVPIADISDAELFVDTVFGGGSADVPVQCRLVISATGSISAGIKNVPKSAFKRFAFINDNDTTTTKNLFTQFVAVFGAPVVGTSVRIRAILVNEISGQTSSAIEANLVVSA